jgi:hypothetical protein
LRGVYWQNEIEKSQLPTTIYQSPITTYISLVTCPLSFATPGKFGTQLEILLARDTNSPKGVYQMKNFIYKTILWQVAVGMISIPALSNSQLSLSAQGNSKFTLGFDNNLYTTASNTYNVTNILPGSHHIRMINAPGAAGACGFPRLLFDGWVNVPDNSKLTAYSNGNLQLDIVSIVSLDQQTVYVDPNVNYGNGYGNYGNGYGNSSDYTNNNYNYGQNYYPPLNYGMSATDFEALKNSIRSKSFDSDKLTIAEQAASANHLSAEQVLEIAQLMDFESSKLDLAKYAYGNAVDRNNYYKVNNAFTFSSSIDELADYINSYHA